MKKSHSIDMTTGSLFKNILVFVLPLMLGNMLQRLYNAADLIVVSRFSQAGSNAMGSVGATGSISGIIVSLCIGFSLGAGVLVSRMFGARDDEGMSSAVHTSMAVSLVTGLCAMVVGITVASPVLTVMKVPQGEVLDGAILYMRIYFAGVPGALIYNFGAAVLRAVGDTRRPLYILVFSGLLNVVLNVILVVGAHLDVAGVAIATTASNYASALAVVVILMKTDEPYKLSLKKLCVNKMDLKYIVRVGLPAGVQSAMFDVSNAIIQSSVNSFGPAAISGYSAGGNIDGMVYISMDAFSSAAVTSVSQNAGAGNWKRVKKTMIISGICVTVAGLFVGILCTAFSQQLLGIYIADSPKAIEFASVLINVVCPTYFLCGIMQVLAGSIRGMGQSFVPMVNSLLGACVFRIFWVFAILPMNKTPFVLFLCWPVSWVIVIALHLIYYLKIRKRVQNQIMMRV